MKRPYLMLASLLVPTRLILAGQCDPPVYAIPYRDGITIDGNRSDWKNTGFAVDLPASKDGSTRAPEDFDVTVRLGWDKQGLLMAAEVHDDRFVEHENIDRLWSRDCIEMFVAPTRGDKSMLQAVIAPGMDPRFEHIETNTPVTIRHCYTHTAGTEGHWIDFTADLEERIVQLFPFYKVGRRYAYNGTGMELVCAMLENIGGESLPNLYKNHLFDPLGCSHTTATTASYDGRSVPLDMARIAQMMLNRGAYGDKRFFGGKTFEKMLPRKLTKMPADDVSKEYGIGLTWVEHYPLGEGAFTHGAASGATTFISPEYNLLICMTRNALGRNFETYHPRFIEAVIDGLAH